MRRQSDLSVGERMVNFIGFVVTGSPVKIETPAPWDLLGRSKTVPPPMLSPSNILSPPTSHWAFIPARQNSTRVQTRYLIILNFLKLRENEMAGCVCILETTDPTMQDVNSTVDAISVGFIPPPR